MIVDIGGGTCEIAIISLAGIVFSRSLRVGGDEFDDTIVAHMKRAYNLMIGERTAEESQDTHRLGLSAGAGINHGSEGPRSELGSAENADHPLGRSSRSLAGAAFQHIGIHPPDPRTLSAGTRRRSCRSRYCDGRRRARLLRGIDRLVAEETGLPVHIADDPLTAVALGTGRVLEELQFLKRVTTNSK